jgi:alpha-D-ribose 1-methylphosphonate 5-triphosphate diphosphatase
MSNQVIFTNARVVTRDDVFAGTVRVEGGRITAVERGRANGTTAAAGAMNLRGDYLVPGMVDVHTDNLERHMLPRSTARWPGLPALLSHDAQVAGSGITTVLDAVCVGMDYNAEGSVRDFGDDSAAALREATAAGWLRAEHFLHLRCDLPGKDTADQLEELLDEPLLRMVSLIDHTPGQRQVRDLSRARKAFSQQGRFSDEEWEERVAWMREKQAKYAPANRRRVLELMEGRAIPVASHDDTTVEHVEEAHAAGIRISEFPTTIEAAHAAKCRGMLTVMGAPNVVLGKSQSGNVSVREVAAAGLLDCLSSDYAPISMLHAAFLLAEGDEGRLPKAMAMVTANPAAAVGLHDRGVIEAGRRADLIQVQAGGAIPRVVQVWREGERVA